MVGGKFLPVGGGSDTVGGVSPEQGMTEEKIQEICKPYGCEVVVAKNGSNPYIMHRLGSGKQYHYVCFIHGNMTEEGLERRVATWCMKKSFE